MYFLCFTAYFTTPFAKYPEHFNQPLTEMASGPQFTTVEIGSLLPSRYAPPRVRLGRKPVFTRFPNFPRIVQVGPSMILRLP